MMYRPAFSAYISNFGKYTEDRELIDFPTDNEKLQEVLQAIGVNGIDYEEVFITEYKSEILNLTKCFGEHEDLNMLNYLAVKVQDSDIEWLEAALELGEYTDSVLELINLLENQDCYQMLRGVANDYDLGYYYVHAMYSDAELVERIGTLVDYLDYEKLGRDIRLNGSGTYTGNKCYIDLIELPTMDYIESVDDIPYEYRLYIK